MNKSYDNDYVIRLYKNYIAFVQDVMCINHTNPSVVSLMFKFI